MHADGKCNSAPIIGRDPQALALQQPQLANHNRFAVYIHSADAEIDGFAHAVLLGDRHQQLLGSACAPIKAEGCWCRGIVFLPLRQWVGQDSASCICLKPVVQCLRVAPVGMQVI